ncbi:hypothetical protein PPTG_23427 [Phytophthora nicotianae INRA-310]|uniref:Uncharacterized protein n=1 Tax=Phytophthora nicotianae (strain INRA-310) TaxID=761204 RepID=W2PZP6_PHYN3|nr:hypothetical protein PPTG_23427 [Phytophthora nicotianae INRA-310]ETN05744.1 hypothetical protein PPTG_23427 [Phytophthora nicotianae INRA-310]
MNLSWGGLAREMMTYAAEVCPGAVIMVVGNDWSYPMATATKMSCSVLSKTPEIARKLRAGSESTWPHPCWPMEPR